jgi:hypothetical protein
MKSAMTLLCGALVFTVAQAQDSPPPPVGGKHMSAREACKPDIQKFCSDAKPGGLRACMKEHKDELSQACKDAGRAHKDAPPTDEATPPPQ